MAHQIKVVVMMIMMVGVIMSHVAEADITCGQVVRSLSPCISYVQNGGAVPGRCCTGIKGLYAAAKSTPDRQAVCRCLKNAVNGISYSNFNLGLAAGLPAKCQVNIPYKISPSTNCNSVQ